MTRLLAGLHVSAARRGWRRARLTSWREFPVFPAFWSHTESGYDHGMQRRDWSPPSDDRVHADRWV